MKILIFVQNLSFFLKGYFTLMKNINGLFTFMSKLSGDPKHNLKFIITHFGNKQTNRSNLRKTNFAETNLRKTEFFKILARPPRPKPAL